MYLFFIESANERVVQCDCSMRFDLEFQDALNNPFSAPYRQTSSMCGGALRQMFGSTSCGLRNPSAIRWSFARGSIIATALGVEVTNAQDADDVIAQLQDFDVSTIPNMQSFEVTATRKLHFFYLKTHRLRSI